MEIVELRVHGVHGTSPGSMLGVSEDDAGQVAGDGLTGIYRSKAPLPLRNLEGTNVSVEAYSWGNLTSGVQGLFGWIKRALWLILLPFALANLSYWARLRMGEDSGTARWGARATRIGALLLTIFMVLTPCLVAIDLIAWQCYRGDSPGCPALPGALDFMARIDSAQRLAVGSLVPLAVITLLWFLSRQSMIRYEEVTSGGEGGAAGSPVPMLVDAEGNERVDVLRHPRLWKGKERTLQLQRVHLASALAVVTAFTGANVLALPAGNPPLVTVTFVVAVTALAASFLWLCVIHPDDIDYFVDSASRLARWRRDHIPEGVRRFARTRVPEMLFWGMAGTTLVHLVGLATLADPVSDKGDFIGRNLWFIGVFVILTAVHLSIFLGGRIPPWPAIGVVVLVLVLAVYALLAHWDAQREEGTEPRLQGLLGETRLIGFGGVALLFLILSVWHFAQRKRHEAEAWNGAGASFMLAAAAWVGLLFTTGIVTVTADYLNGDEHGVDDLVTVTEPITETLAPNKPEVRGGTRELTATGTVTIKDAVVVRGDDGALTVTHGRIESESLFEAAEPDAEDASRLAGLQLALDATRVTSAEVTVPGTFVAIEDSCIRERDVDALGCSAEDADFIAAGTLPLPEPSLMVDGEAGPVTLVVQKPPQMPLAIPQVLIWSPLLELLWLVAVIAFLVGAVVVFGVKAREPIDALVDADPAIAPRDKAAAKNARRRAAFAHRAETLLDRIGTLTAIAAVAIIALSATAEPPWVKFPWTRNIATVSMYVAAALALGLVYVASRLRTSDETRRGVGVLWDLSTFWPRAAHPLAPPCYAERVVPELKTRTGWVLGDQAGENRVILSGHSQGSAILVALLCRLRREDLRRVRVITYGSQIRALYGRVFPRVFGAAAVGYAATTGPMTLDDAWPDAPTPGHGTPSTYTPPAEDPNLDQQAWRGRPLFDRLHLAGGAWVSLFRRTDPLGFRVFSDTDTAPDHPVPEVPPVTTGDPGPTVQGHSGYQHSPQYRAIVRGWTQEPEYPLPQGTQGLPFLPPP
ncbi:MAG TPA: hypothetical protein VFK52_01775 [Nocardioidaceae bacterium]|nr:hypothetical protein [Nocardioidaceae bacterium]